MNSLKLMLPHPSRSTYISAQLTFFTQFGGRGLVSSHLKMIMIIPALIPFLIYPFPLLWILYLHPTLLPSSQCINVLKCCPFLVGESSQLLFLTTSIFIPYFYFLNYYLLINSLSLVFLLSIALNFNYLSITKCSGRFISPLIFLWCLILLPALVFLKLFQPWFPYHSPCSFCYSDPLDCTFLVVFAQPWTALSSALFSLHMPSLQNLMHSYRFNYCFQVLVSQILASSPDFQISLPPGYYLNILQASQTWYVCSSMYYLLCSLISLCG